MEISSLELNAEVYEVYQKSRRSRPENSFVGYNVIHVNHDKPLEDGTRLDFPLDFCGSIEDVVKAIISHHVQHHEDRGYKIPDIAVTSTMPRMEIYRTNGDEETYTPLSDREFHAVHFLIKEALHKLKKRRKRTV